MTDTPAGSRYCSGTTVTDHPGDRRLTARMIAEFQAAYAMTGFVVCRCRPTWSCGDPETVPRGDRRYPQNKVEAPIPDAGYYMDRV